MASRKRVPYRPPAELEMAVNVAPKAIKWIIDGVVPCGMISLVAGRPGWGKSLFSMWLASLVSRRAGGGVLFSNVEDLRAEVLRPRFEAAGANLTRIHFFEPDIESINGLTQLREMVEKLKIRLIVLDPISAHVKASVWNDQRIRGVLKPFFEAVLQPTGCAALIVAHTTKRISKSAHPLEVIGGSGGGLVAASRMVYIFGPNPDVEDERVLASAKVNIAKPVSMAFDIEEVEVDIGRGVLMPMPRLVLTDKDADVTARKVLSDTGTGKGSDPVKVAIAAEWLTSFLMFGPQKVKDLRESAAADGITFASLRAAADKLDVQRRRGGPGWSLPEGHPALTIAKIAQPLFDRQSLTFGPGEVTVEDVLAMIDADTNPGDAGGDGPDDEDDE